jgi:uncharacterized protein (TIGR03435 family)
MARLLLLAIPCATVLLTAQTLSPAFDVASVRVNKSGDPSRSVRAMPGGRFEATNAPLRNVIRFAFELRTLGEIEGAPEWMDTTAFDIRASGPADASVPRMVQTLLVERFKLVARRDVRERPVYALTLGRGDGSLGPSLEGSHNGPCTQTEKRTDAARDHQSPDLASRCVAWSAAGSDRD